MSKSDIKFTLKCGPPSHLAKVTRMTVAVSSQFHALHCWITAPDEVGYLRLPHKHKFTVDAYVDVENADRQIEFYLLIAVLERCIKHTLEYLPYELAPNGEKVYQASCETFATEIGQALFDTDYLEHIKGITVRVCEDAVNCAFVSLERI
jgi:hypothetical protein